MSRNPLVRFHRPLRCVRLEPRQLLSGVTLITHGFNSGVNDWVTAMANAIQARPELSIDSARYKVTVTDIGHDGQELTVESSWLSGPTPTTSSSAEIVLLLDWSDVDGELSFGGGYHRSTVDVAAAVAQMLLAPGFLYEDAAPLAELPLHLIGHSRGASLVGELAKDLGQQGVWVDQVTTLDPHPVDGVREPSWPFNFNFGDAPMTAWENTVYWDNYWRTEGNRSLDFTGESVANTYNVQLSESVLSSGGYSYEHSDVHLWYHGTIDTSSTASDGSYVVPTSWYGGSQPRDATGYYYSRLVGGSRQSAGLAMELGGAAIRADFGWTGAVWANVLNLEVIAGDLAFLPGEEIPTRYYYDDRDSSATIAFSLDPDRNPYNDNGIAASPSALVSKTTDPALGATSLNTGGIASGTYYVAAKMSDGGHTRYAYAPDPITIANTVDNPPMVSLTNPPEGATISGTVTVTAAASDDHGVTKVEFFVDASKIGEDTNPEGGWSTSWVTTAESNGSHVVTATATDTIEQTASDFNNVTVSNAVISTTHVADLDGTAASVKKGWTATVAITVHDTAGNPLSGATVQGAWTGGFTGTASGTTSNGQVSFSTGNIPTKKNSVTFTVNNITAAGFTYDPSADYDPDIGHAGTNITISRPGTSAKNAVAAASDDLEAMYADIAQAYAGEQSSQSWRPSKAKPTALQALDYAMAHRI